MDVALVNTTRNLATLCGMDTTDESCLRDAVSICFIQKTRAMSRQVALTPKTVVETVAVEAQMPDVPDAEIQKTEAKACMTIGEDIVLAMRQTFKVANFLPRNIELDRNRDSGHRELRLSKDSNSHYIGCVIPHGSSRISPSGLPSTRPHPTKHTTRGTRSR